MGIAKKSFGLRLILIAITLFVFFSSQTVFGQKNKATFIQATPNFYAPNLYSEKINLQILLVDLPGSSVKGSFFQGSYKIYFVPEGEMEKLARSNGGIINELGQNDISNKILLSSGGFDKTLLKSNRVVEKVGIPFKSKVPDKSRTMLGRILIFYTIKIYDGKIEKTIYKDSSFSYFPFERESPNSPRDMFHLSFFVNENGKLYTSSLPRDKSSVIW